MREPLSGQRVLSARARGPRFPVAAGLRRRDADDDRRAPRRARRPRGRARPRPPCRPDATSRGFAHRGRQLVELTLATGPLARNYRGLRLPLVGGVVGARRARRSRRSPRSGSPTTSGAARSAASARTSRAGATTGTLKLVGIPLWALWRTRSPSGAVLVGLAANVVNQLDTRPGRALKAFLLGSRSLGGRPRRALAVAVLLAPYDHREMTMLGDAGRTPSEPC